MRIPDQFKIVVGVCLGLFFVMEVQAQTYPAKPVRVIVPLAPGGGHDSQARILSRRLSEETKQSFFVENRPMAGGSVALVSVSKASPDGYTLLAVSPSLALAPLTGNAVDPVKDFSPISLVTRQPQVLVVNSSFPARTVKDFIAIAKSKPGAINFGGSPAGNIVHLAAIWFFSLSEINVSYVPYKGTGPATFAVVSGEVVATMTSVIAAIPFLKSGQMRALGITTLQRSKLMPDLATIAEQGVPGYEFVSFHGWVAPAGTPSSIVNHLSILLKNAAHHPEVAKLLAASATEPVGSTPQQFRDIIAAEVTRWRKIVDDNGIKVQE